VPANLYRRAAREFVLRAPPRDYRLLAELLVHAADDDDPPVNAALGQAAAHLGESLAATGDRLEQILRDHGYEPFLSERGRLRLRNCPFDSLAARCPAVVCGLNLALIRGILTGLGADPGRASLTPQEGNCCVAIRTDQEAEGRATGRPSGAFAWAAEGADP